MLAKTGHQLSDLDVNLPKRHQSTNSVACPWEAKGTVMRRAMEYSENKERILIDGVKVLEDGITVLLVPDREQAAFTVTAEADDEATANDVRDRYSELVAQWREGN